MSQFCSYLLQSLGLISDIIGVCLLFKYGIPELMQTGGAYILRTGIVDQTSKALEDKFKKLGYFGLLLLVVGFVLQLIPNAMGLYNAS
jgi:hypothetical protein